MADSETILSAGSLEADKQLISVLTAQFNSCRTEIQSRSSNQGTVINLNITAIGVLGGYYFSYHADPFVLLLIPLVSPMLGIIWADHAINIGNLGRFIEYRLVPLLSSTLKHDLPDYETFVHLYEEQRFNRFFLLIAPMLFIFAILPASAIVLAWAVAVRDALFWVLLAMGTALILLFVSYLASIHFGWAWRSKWPPNRPTCS